MCDGGGGGPGVTGDTVNAFNSMDPINSALNAARGDFSESGFDAAQSVPMASENGVSVGVNQPMNWGFDPRSALTAGKTGLTLGAIPGLIAALGGGIYGGSNQGDMSLAFGQESPDTGENNLGSLDAGIPAGGPGSATGGGDSPPGAAPGSGGGSSPSLAAGPSSGQYYNRFTGAQLTPEQFMQKLNSAKFMR